jgi:hypothetical protein
MPIERQKWRVIYALVAAFFVIALAFVSLQISRMLSETNTQTVPALSQNGLY